MSYCVTGRSSTIIRELNSLIPGETSFSIGRNMNDDLILDLAEEFDVEKIPVHFERYVLAAGVLYPKRVSEQSFAETARSLAVNLTSVMRICDYLIERNPRARIAVISSESARGSFDATYFTSKAALNAYIEHKKIGSPHQQIIGISPTIIIDSAMTERRHDIESVRLRAEKHPKGRFLSAAEVARMIHFMLWVDAGYTSNTVIHMNGGMFA